MAGGKTCPETISVIVPTYREAPNIRPLVEAIQTVREAGGLDLDLWIMDDPSDDGVEREVAACAARWAHLVTRSGRRGLSAAVVDGIHASRGEIIVVMDADLSHPPERIPEMLQALRDGAEMVIGSRYVPGGSTDATWSLFRWANSKLATLLARPLVNVRDPMSGFFALRRPSLAAAAPLHPIGYKIALELIVKCRMRHVAETPIHFSERRLGQSKLTFAEQMRYLIHLRRLYGFRFRHGIRRTPSRGIDPGAYPASKG